MSAFKSLLFLAILGLSSAARDSAEFILSGSAAADHFWKTLNPSVSMYESEPAVDDENGLPVKRYKNKNTDEHFIDIGFEEIGGATVLKFFYAKKDDVVKSMKKYNSEHIRIQSKVFPEFIKRMVRVQAGEGRKLYLNMIEDIKESILNLADKNRLYFKEMIIGDEVRLELNYDENLLGIFKITSEAKSEHDFFLIVTFLITYNNADPTVQKVEIPVLTNQKGTFEAKMGEITSKLVLKDYINCNRDNLGNFEAFGKASFGSLVKIIPPKDISSTSMIKFDLKAPDETATGRIVYVPPTNQNDVGSYEFIVELNGVEVIKKPFKRMSTDAYLQFLKSLNIPDIFKSLWDKIVTIYIDKVKAAYQDTGKEPIISKSVTKHLMSSPTYRCQAIHGGMNVALLEFEEVSDSAVVTLKTDFKAFSHTQLKFVRQSFNPEIIGTFFENTVAMIKNARVSKLAIRSSIKRLRV